METVAAERTLAGFPAEDIELAGKGSADIVLAVLIALDSRTPSVLRSYGRKQTCLG